MCTTVSSRACHRAALGTEACEWMMLVSRRPPSVIYTFPSLFANDILEIRSDVVQAILLLQLPECAGLMLAYPASLGDNQAILLAYAEVRNQDTEAKTVSAPCIQSQGPKEHPGGPRVPVHKGACLCLPGCFSKDYFMDDFLPACMCAMYMESPGGQRKCQIP